MEDSYQLTYSFKPKDYKKLESAFDVIVDKTGIAPTEVLKNEFVNISAKYIADLHLVDYRPRISIQKQTLKKFIKATERYSKVIESLDGATIEKIHHIGLTRVGAKKVHDLEQDLIFFRNIAEEALNEVQTFIDPGGPKQKRAERFYIKGLINIYSKGQTKDKTFAAYQDPYLESCNGAFYHFVNICLECIGYPPESAGALCERIKEVKKTSLN